MKKLITFPYTFSMLGLCKAVYPEPYFYAGTMTKSKFNYEAEPDIAGEYPVIDTYEFILVESMQDLDQNQQNFATIHGGVLRDEDQYIAWISNNQIP
jgi:hypothetical protein